MSKTSILGILAIVVAVCNAAIQMLQGHPVDFAATLTAITTGVGLIKAADAPKPPTTPAA